MSERRADTKALATRYARSSRAAKKTILDELCAVTGRHRHHARKALRRALVLRPAKARAPRPSLWGDEVIKALRFCWAVQRTPCGRLLAAALPDVVPRLRRFEELDINGATKALLLRIAPATIDRRLSLDRAKLEPSGRSHTKPRNAVEGLDPDADPGPNGTTRCRGSWRSTWSATRAATAGAGSAARLISRTLPQAGPRPVREEQGKWVFAKSVECEKTFMLPSRPAHGSRPILLSRRNLTDWRTE